MPEKRRLSVYIARRDWWVFDTVKETSKRLKAAGRKTSEGAVVRAMLLTAANELRKKLEGK